MSSVAGRFRSDALQHISEVLMIVGDDGFERSVDSGMDGLHCFKEFAV